MKREFLEKLGLGKAAIDAVMAENGKSIEELRLRCEEQEKEKEIASLKEEKEQFSALSEEKEGLKKALADANTAFEAFRDGVITSAAAEAMPSSTMAKKELIRCLREASEKGEDLRETVRRLKEADPDAFLKSGAGYPLFSTACFSCVEEFPPLSSALKRR